MAQNLMASLNGLRDGDEVWLKSTADDGPVLACTLARSHLARMCGYLKAGADRGRDAVLFTATSAVHTFGMRFPLDVIHLSDQGKILAIVHLAPWRLGPMVRGTRHIVELPASRHLAWALSVGGAFSLSRTEPPNITGRL